MAVTFSFDPADATDPTDEEYADIDAFRDAAGLTRDKAVRLLPVVVEIVDDYAPDAPAAVSDEAAIRLGGYLGAATPTPNVAQGALSIGDITTSSQGAHSHARAFAVSGAEALLSRWRVRRGVVVTRS